MLKKNSPATMDKPVDLPVNITGVSQASAAAESNNKTLLIVRCFGLGVSSKANFKKVGMLSSLYKKATGQTSIKKEKRVIKISQSEPLPALRPSAKVISSHLNFGLIYVSEPFEDRVDLTPSIVVVMNCPSDLECKLRLNVYLTSGQTGGKETMLAGTTFSRKELLRAMKTSGVLISEMNSEHCAAAKAYIEVMNPLAKALNTPGLNISAPLNDYNPLNFNYVFYNEEDTVTPYIEGEEVAIEPMFASHIPILFLENFTASLVRSINAWNLRYELERMRQGRFKSLEEAHSFGWHSVSITVKALRIGKASVQTERIQLQITRATHLDSVGSSGGENSGDVSRTAGARSMSGASTENTSVNPNAPVYQICLPVIPQISNAATDDDHSATDGELLENAGHRRDGAPVLGQSSSQQQKSKRVDETMPSTFVEVHIADKTQVFLNPIGRTNTEHHSLNPVYGSNLHSAQYGRKNSLNASAGSDTVQMVTSVRDFEFFSYLTTDKDVFAKAKYHRDRFLSNLRQTNRTVKRISLVDKSSSESTGNNNNHAENSASDVNNPIKQDSSPVVTKKSPRLESIDGRDGPNSIEAKVIADPVRRGKRWHSHGAVLNIPDFTADPAHAEEKRARSKSVITEGSTSSAESSASSRPVSESSPVEDLILHRSVAASRHLVAHDRISILGKETHFYQYVPRCDGISVRFDVRLEDSATNSRRVGTCSVDLSPNGRTESWMPVDVVLPASNSSIGGGSKMFEDVELLVSVSVKSPDKSIIANNPKVNQDGKVTAALIASATTSPSLEHTNDAILLASSAINVAPSAMPETYLYRRSIAGVPINRLPANQTMKEEDDPIASKTMNKAPFVDSSTQEQPPENTQKLRSRNCTLDDFGQEVTSLYTDYKASIADCYEWMWHLGFNGQDPMIVLNSSAVKSLPPTQKSKVSQPSPAPRPPLLSSQSERKIKMGNLSVEKKAPLLARQQSRKSAPDPHALSTVTSSASKQQLREPDSDDEDDNGTGEERVREELDVEEAEEMRQTYLDLSAGDEGQSRSNVFDLETDTIENELQSSLNEKGEEADDDPVDDDRSDDRTMNNNLGAVRCSTVDIDSDDDNPEPENEKEASSSASEVCNSIRGGRRRSSKDKSSQGPRSQVMFPRIDFPYPLGWIREFVQSLEQLAIELRSLLPKLRTMNHDGRSFRASPLKKASDMQALPINLHYQLLSVRQHTSARIPATEVIHSITCGAMSPHMLGHKKGGLFYHEGKFLRKRNEMEWLKHCFQHQVHASGGKCIPRTAPHSAYNTLQTLSDYALKIEEMSLLIGRRRFYAMSQALSVAVNAVLLKLSLCAEERLEYGMCELWLRCGFLVMFEGLLSVVNHERSMLEDTISAVEALRSFQVRVIEHKQEKENREFWRRAMEEAAAKDVLEMETAQSGSPEQSSASIDEKRNAFNEDNQDKYNLQISMAGREIRVEIPSAALKRMPEIMQQAVLDDRAIMPLVPVLFTQGIDIQQTLMTTFGGDSKGSVTSIDLQQHVNLKGLRDLNYYCFKVQPIQSYDHLPVLKVGLAGGSNSPSADSRVRNTTASSGASMVDNAEKGMKEFMKTVKKAEMSEVHQGKAKRIGDDDLGGVSAAVTSSFSQDDNDDGDNSKEKRSNSGVFVGMSPEARRRSMLGSSRGSLLVPVDRAAEKYIHPLVHILHTTILEASPTLKNVDLLVEVERLALVLGGCRVTFCKSGKDRTGMACTLEQSRQLGDRFGCGVSNPRLLRDANIMRVYGCRVMVAEKNIGKRVYSINKLQAQFLPSVFRPPGQVCEELMRKDNS